MQASEVAELLALASAYDNRNVTKEAAIGWKVAIDSQLPDLGIGLARELIVDHFATSGDYFTVKHLIDGAKARMRRMPKQIADDVGSAKARGMIDRSWDSRTPLPIEVAERLAAVRAGEARELKELGGFEAEGPQDSSLVLDVGRRV